jgi:hypothetical protein
MTKILNNGVSITNDNFVDTDLIMISMPVFDETGFVDTFVICGCSWYLHKEKIMNHFNCVDVQTVELAKLVEIFTQLGISYLYWVK